MHFHERQQGQGPNRPQLQTAGPSPASSRAGMGAGAAALVLSTAGQPALPWVRRDLRGGRPCPPCLRSFPLCQQLVAMTALFLILLFRDLNKVQKGFATQILCDYRPGRKSLTPNLTFSGRMCYYSSEPGDRTTRLRQSAAS